MSSCAANSCGEPRVAMIAAVAENGVIGNGNKMPWHIPSEFGYFVKVTKHKSIIMGRKTFDSLLTMGVGPLPNRENIIVTRDAGYSHAGIQVVGDIPAALAMARKTAQEKNLDEVIIGGGSEIYKLCLPMADRLYITEVHLKPEGDAYFPSFDKNEWVETKREFHKAKEGETADYTITVLDRKCGKAVNE